MLRVINLSKSFGGQTVLHNVSFTVNSDQRVGLIGSNGCGKTTLLRIIVGQEKPDTGSVQLSPPNLRIGYLAQALEYTPEATVGQVIWQKAQEMYPTRALSSNERSALMLALANVGLICNTRPPFDLQGGLATSST